MISKIFGKEKINSSGFFLFSAIGVLLVLVNLRAIFERKNGFLTPYDPKQFYDIMYYNMTFLSANYIDIGFVRRGLGGTISRVLFNDPDTGAITFHILSTAALILSLLILGWKSLKKISFYNTLFLMMFCVISPQLFLGWENDIARTDMAVIACIVLAAVSLVTDRPSIAALMLFVGFLAHETAIIFGLPLIFVIALARSDTGLRGLRHLLPHAIGLAVAVVGIALVQGSLTPDTDVFVRRMIEHTPPPPEQWYKDIRDCAIYMMVGGLRGLKTAMCYNLYYKAYPLMIAFTLLITIANGLILGVERHWMLFIMAIVGPTLFMDLVANDMGRWVKFGCAATWVLSVVLHDRGVVSLDGRRLVVSSVLLGVLLLMGSSGVHSVNRASEKLAVWLGYPAAPEIGDWMTHCDPNWRSVIAGSARNKVTASSR